jgi:U3 small nucleolar RNA-associated protein 3
LIQKSSNYAHRDITYNTEEWARNEKPAESLPTSCERARLAKTFRLNTTSTNSSWTQRTTSSQDEIKYYWRKALQANAEGSLRKKVGFFKKIGSLEPRMLIRPIEQFLQPSDEEVLGYDEDEIDDDDDDFQDEVEGDIEDGEESSTESRKGGDAEDAENLREWGTTKADYYNADAIETEADALEEEAEARRLQQTQLQKMTEADFGFDESQWLQDGTDTGEEASGTVIEKLPDIEIPSDMPIEDRLRVLKNRYPEFEPLAKDFMELQTLHADLRLAAKAAEAVVVYKSSPKKRKLSEIDSEVMDIPTPIAVVKLRALSAYLGTIAVYFALLTSTKGEGQTKLAMPPAELRDHPVIQSLVRCKQLWERVKDTPLPEVKDIALEVESQIETKPPSNVPQTSNSLNGDTQIKPAPKKKKRKSKAEKSALAAQAAAEAERLERIRRTESRLADLSSLLPSSKKTAKTKTTPIHSLHGEADSDFGDETALTAEEAAEKAQRKKSLRFYTSQIAQKSNKRGAASRDAGGDMDLPHKERLKDRQARLMREAEKRGKQDANLNEQLGVDDSGDDAEDMKVARQIRGDDLEDEDGYYDMIAAQTKQKKVDKRARAYAHAEAAKQGGEVYTQEEVGPDGKRAITYAIAKNKGLAPRRKKEVRNPRVKKRKKFDEKMKKLGSIRQVYKGGEGRGGYGGELTGIKKNLVKSVKL